jgi:hypothetical protein
MAECVVVVNRGGVWFAAGSAHAPAAPGSADRKLKDAQVRAAINQQLVESGEKERCVRGTTTVGLAGTPPQ